MSPTPDDFTITDRSEAMTGASLPPGLRFPTGAIIGTHLIIAGTYLAHSYQSFSIWALDLVTMTWSRIDAGTALTSGSWSRGCLWEDGAKLLIFGNRAGNLVEDYNRRLLSWDHVAYIDLEAFGIYQPPRLALDLRAQELGLAALEEGVLADFEIICDDGRKIKCSRKALEDRWPWFKEQRKIYLTAAARALETLPASTSADIPLPVRRPIMPEGISEVQQDALESRPDPRLTPRSFHLSEPYAITMALLQYIYSLALITPLQHAPPVLSALLLLATTYNMPHLESLVKHAMHKALSPGSSVGVYEVATLCDCQSLQIR
jgi:leucine-zipper-like transcriptional regulator 1